MFGIPTRKDTLNEPIPQDGSYAYAIKKCAGVITFTDEGIPLLIGSEKKYKKFEDGENKGHIYVVKGQDFRPEYDGRGVAAEYITEQQPELVKHIEVSPKEAMAHNAQFIMFTSTEYEDKWSENNSFRAGVTKDSEFMRSLAEEVKAGRAVYINATDRGVNPLIPLLEQASAERVSQALDSVRSKKEKLEQRKDKDLSPNEGQSSKVAVAQNRQMSAYGRGLGR